jgi:hypothetical protein
MEAAKEIFSLPENHGTSEEADRSEYAKPKRSWDSTHLLSASIPCQTARRLRPDAQAWRFGMPITGHNFRRKRV